MRAGYAIPPNVKLLWECREWLQGLLSGKCRLMGMGKATGTVSIPPGKASPPISSERYQAGGGRAGCGVIAYFDELRASDSTDALRRTYIQWGTSYSYPSDAMAHSITAPFPWHDRKRGNGE